ncbi:MAG: CHAT domain-containing protein [Acidobacteria bacterium]|nr:CHAT domain-containing protein [Acidobacteriota bacterium]
MKSAPIDQIVDKKKPAAVGKVLFPVAAGLLLLVVLFGVWKSFVRRPSAEQEGLTELRAAFRGRRNIESRTTGGLDYAPLTVTRGAEQILPADETARLRAKSLLLEAVGGAEDAGPYHALGLFYLNEKQFDAALGQLNSALVYAPDDPGLRNDAGAACLEKAALADTDGRGDEFFENADAGLRHLDRALALDADRLEPLFNRALLLQKMRLGGEARRAWEKYLEKDAASPWAEEARRNLELLEKRAASIRSRAEILSDFLDAFRARNDSEAWRIVSETKEFVTGVMLSGQLAQGFLEADAENRKTEAAELLSALRYLGELENKNAGDPYFAELAAFYQKSSAPQRARLGAAQREIQKAQAFLFEPNFNEALKSYDRARQLLAAAGDVWNAGLVEYQICYCLCQIDRLDESNARLKALSDRSRLRNHKWLRSLADNWIGGNYLSLGEISKAVAANRQSLELARETGDVYNIQRNYIQMAEEYRTIDNAPKALSLIRESIGYPTTYHEFPRQTWRNLFFTTQILFTFKLYAAAAVYAGEEIDFAGDRLKDNWMIHAGLIHAGVINGQLGRFPEALGQVRKSVELAETFPDEEMKQRLLAESYTTLAHLERLSGDCGAAVENYGRAIEIGEKMRSVIGVYDARRGRLLCYVAGDDPAVRSEMEILKRQFDENRRQIGEEADRNIFFDNQQNVYDIATGYAYLRLRDPEQAFDYAESSRARSLLDSIEKDAKPVSEPLGPAAIRRSMPAGAQMLYYAVLPDRILIWHLSGADFTTVEAPVGQDLLEDRIRRYSKLLIARTDDDERRALAGELYGWLIAPVESSLEKDKPVCIVGDKALLRLPFASLVTPAGKYLIEDYALSYAPSATVFIKETEIAARKPAAGGETLLSIGNPAFSRSEYAGLDNLPSAADEARGIVDGYRNPKLFLAGEARKESILNNLNSTDVVHYAGHYVPNEKSPAQSKFLLAAGDLTVEEINRQKLSRVRLIVLSACETGVETYYGGEGMIGAARAFLEADVPLIVGSQWAVDSEATAALMIRFHDYRKKQNLPTTAALRRAQLDLLTAPDSRFREPFYWAGFLPIGGYANY